MAWNTCGVAALLAALLVGCGGGNGAAAGGERGPCYPNATCDQGLTCLSGFCVRVDGGGAGAGGSGGLAAGDAGGGGGARAGAGGSGGADAGYDVALHPPLPQVADLGGPVLATPKVLPIFYANDSATSNIKGFLTSLMKGSYWHATTSEYGVGPLTILPAVTLPAAVQSTITDTALQAQIAVNTGSSGAWGGADPNTIYLFVLPPGLAATQGAGVCCTDFGGYHGEANVGGLPVAYAVVCTCPGFLGPGFDDLDERTGAMSHELIEAATDPFPLSDPALQQADQANIAWTLVSQGELGDMCAIQPDTFDVSPDSSYVVQRTWSNAAALRGNNPCVPAPKAVPYFNSMPVLDLLTIKSDGTETRGVQIAVGGSRTIPLNLFSVGPVPHAWSVRAYSYEEVRGGTASLSFSLDRSTGTNGDVLHLTITALKTNTDLGVDPFVIVSTYGAPSDVDYQTNISMGLVFN